MISLLYYCYDKCNNLYWWWCIVARYYFVSFLVSIKEKFSNWHLNLNINQNFVSYWWVTFFPFFIFFGLVCKEWFVWIHHHKMCSSFEPEKQFAMKCYSLYYIQHTYRTYVTPDSTYVPCNVHLHSFTFSTFHLWSWLVEDRDV